MKDLEKRKRVMARSMRLGHCICNAKKACPCDVFQQQDVCPCAGESLDGQAGPVRLMSLVESAGCASKIDQGDARPRARRAAVPRRSARAGRRAGRRRCGRVSARRRHGAGANRRCLLARRPTIRTLFGQIAAANSLSDVYAMGGRPITALSIVGFPLHTVPDDALHEILRGGVDKMAEAGVAVVGGHSINDSEIKAGFAVTGTDPSRQDRHQRRRPAGRLPDPDQAAGHGHHGLRRADRPRAGRRAGGRRAVDGPAQPRRGRS